MKKTICVLLLIAISVLFVFAANEKTNSYGYMYDNEYFAQVLDAVNTKAPYDTLSKVFKNALDNMSNDVATKLRLKMVYYDYLNTTDAKKYKNETKAGIDSCYKDLEELERTNTIPVLKDSLTFLLYGIDYRVNGSISKGTKSIKIIDELYEKNKDDEGIMLLYAQRKAEAPAIGGGNTSVALSILKELESNLENKTKAFKFAVYSELALVYSKSDKTKSSSYQKMASSLY